MTGDHRRSQAVGRCRERIAELLGRAACYKRRTLEASFRRTLDCGIVDRGFARVVCPSCQYEVLVPFSCKSRGPCPSCDGRRMADGAVHLVDHVLPSCADVRQWTLSLPR